MQTSRCGSANHIRNLIQGTIPLDVYMYVKIFSSIFSPSLWFTSWLCTAYTRAQHTSTAWCLTYDMKEWCA